VRASRPGIHDRCNTFGDCSMRPCLQSIATTSVSTLPPPRVNANRPPSPVDGSMRRPGMASRRSHAEAATLPPQSPSATGAPSPVDGGTRRPETASRRSPVDAATLPPQSPSAAGAPSPVDGGTRRPGTSSRSSPVDAAMVSPRNVSAAGALRPVDGGTRKLGMASTQNPTDVATLSPRSVSVAGALRPVDCAMRRLGETGRQRLSDTAGKSCNTSNAIVPQCQDNQTFDVLQEGLNLPAFDAPKSAISEHHSVAPGPALHPALQHSRFVRKELLPESDPPFSTGTRLRIAGELQASPPPSPPTGRPSMCVADETAPPQHQAPHAPALHGLAAQNRAPREQLETRRYFNPPKFVLSKFCRSTMAIVSGLAVWVRPLRLKHSFERNVDAQCKTSLTSFKPQPNAPQVGLWDLLDYWIIPSIFDVCSETNLPSIGCLVVKSGLILIGALGLYSTRSLYGDNKVHSAQFQRYE